MEKLVLTPNVSMEQSTRQNTDDLIVRSLNILTDGIRLSFDDAYYLMQCMMEGKLTEVQLTAILTALRLSEINGEEITGFAQAMSSNSIKITSPADKPLLDIVGTGGSHFKSFNVSTVCSLILPLMGMNIAKHGNRTSTSKSGSADLLEELGVNIAMNPDTAERSLFKLGLTFLFAPTFHPAMKHVGPVRRQMRVKTIFNLLGPLTNPAGVKHQVTGVFSRKLMLPVIESFKQMKYKRVAVVHNSLEADEIIQIGRTYVIELIGNKINRYTLQAKDFGVSKCDINQVTNKIPHDTARDVIELLNGKLSPIADLIAINSAMAIRVAGIEENLKENTQLVLETIETGKGIDLLSKFVKETGGNQENLENLLLTL